MIEDIQANSDREAAEYALALLKSKDSGTHIFDATNENTDKKTQVDLEDE
jgi:hypothetical protein